MRWASSCLFWAAGKWRVSFLTCSSNLCVPPHFPHLWLSTLSDALNHRLDDSMETRLRNISSRLVTLVLSLTVPLVMPFSHRFSRRVCINAIMVMNIATLAIAMGFTLRSHFDEHHQCRLFVLSSDNACDNVRDFAFPCNFLKKKFVVYAGVAESSINRIGDIAANFGLVGVQPIHCSRRHA